MAVIDEHRHGDAVVRLSRHDFRDQRKAPEPRPDFEAIAAHLRRIGSGRPCRPSGDGIGRLGRNAGRGLQRITSACKIQIADDAVQIGFALRHEVQRRAYVMLARDRIQPSGVHEPRQDVPARHREREAARQDVGVPRCKHQIFVVNGDQYAAAVVAQCGQKGQQRFGGRIDDMGFADVARAASREGCRLHTDDGNPGSSERANSRERAWMVDDAKNDGPRQAAIARNPVRDAHDRLRPHRIQHANVPVRDVQKPAAAERPIVDGLIVRKKARQDAREAACSLFRVDGNEALSRQGLQALVAQAGAPGHEQRESSAIDRCVQQSRADGFIRPFEIGHVDAVERAEIARPSRKDQIAVDARVTKVEEAELAQRIGESPSEVFAIPRVPDAPVVRKALYEVGHCVEPGRPLDRDRRPGQAPSRHGRIQVAKRSPLIGGREEARIGVSPDHRQARNRTPQPRAPPGVLADAPQRPQAAGAPPPARHQPEAVHAARVADRDEQAMSALGEVGVRHAQDARHEPAVAAFARDQRVVGEQRGKSSRRDSRLEACAVESPHSDDAIPVERDIDQRLADVRVPLVLPLQIAHVERAVRAPKAFLQLRDRALVLGAALRDTAFVHRRIPTRIPSR